jgi:hypothetical protein
MDLLGRLSNPSPKVLAVLDLSLPAARPARKRAAKPESQLRVGDVRDAMIAVLAEAGKPLRVSVIHERVVQKLGEPVTYGHVKDFLSVRSRGLEEKRLFAKAGSGRYLLHGSVDPEQLWPKVGCERSSRSAAERQGDSRSRTDPERSDS